MRFRYAKPGIRAIGLLAAEEEREHARDVGLERQRREVEHQLGVVIIGLRHTDRPVGKVDDRLTALSFGNMNTALDLAHRIEIFGHADTVAGAKPTLQRRDGLSY